MNQLYPVFLKLDQLNTLIVGGGKTALEKISFLLKSSPNAKVTIVAATVLDEILNLAENHPDLKINQRPFLHEDLEGVNVLILATGNRELNNYILNLAKEKNILVNTADTPDLCDFYLGSIVTKGDVKIAISTNGKSPTLAKRLREFFETVLPDDISTLVNNLHYYRQKITGNFQEKVEKLNKITGSFVEKEEKKRISSLFTEEEKVA